MEGADVFGSKNRLLSGAHPLSGAYFCNNCIKFKHMAISYSNHTLTVTNPELRVLRSIRQDVPESIPDEAAGLVAEMYLGRLADMAIGMALVAKMGFGIPRDARSQYEVLALFCTNLVGIALNTIPSDENSRRN